MAYTICDVHCNFTIAFIRWDLVTLTFDRLTSNVYRLALTFDLWTLK